MRWLVMIVLLAGTGCRQLFGIDDTSVAGADAAADAAAGTGDAPAGPDATPDANLTADANLATCPAPYVQVAGGFPVGATYRGVSNPTSWNPARDQCLADGADLVVVDNEAEAAAVAGMVENGASPYFWVGLMLQGGVWRTVRGEPAIYLPWAAGEPSGGTSQCGLFRDTGAPHELYDFVCGSPQIFVCECLP